MDRKASRLIPIEQMREYLAVDPTSRTGLRWIKSRRSGTAVAGAEAGAPCTDGYFRFSFNNTRYFNSRVIYAIHHGVDPGILQIDHINRNRQDNRIQNLRLVSNRKNNQNRSDHGQWPVGVSYHRGVGKFQAAIYANQKTHYLGLFADPESASAAYQKACAELAAAGARDAE